MPEKKTILIVEDKANCFTYFKTKIEKYLKEKGIEGEILWAKSPEEAKAIIDENRNAINALFCDTNLDANHLETSEGIEVAMHFGDTEKTIGMSSDPRWWQKEWEEKGFVFINKEDIQETGLNEELPEEIRNLIGS